MNSILRIHFIGFQTSETADVQLYMHDIQLIFYPKSCLNGPHADEGDQQTREDGVSETSPTEGRVEREVKRKNGDTGVSDVGLQGDERPQGETGDAADGNCTNSFHYLRETYYLLFCIILIC